MNYSIVFIVVLVILLAGIGYYFLKNREGW